MASKIVSVSELNRLARQVLERELPLLWVGGEISNLTRASSGHVYFSLKDESAQVRCVMFRSRAQVVAWQLANGQQVEARALASIYESRGDFQLTVESLRRAGLGRLYEAFARLKAKLEAEGLFDPARKRILPPYPGTIGIVSSPQAAALQDVLASLRRRAPHVRLILYPTTVQGESAGEQIAAAIKAAGRHAQCEVLLVVRGGGSIEDLWAFNEEVVTRAIAASPIPVIAGVGHETDTTMADFVADLRAATPTAAAEIVSASWFAARKHLSEASYRLQHCVQRQLQQCQQRIDDLGRRIVHPAIRLKQHRERLNLLENRLKSRLIIQVQERWARLMRIESRFAKGTPRIPPLRQHLGYLQHRLQQGTIGYMVSRRQKLRSLADALEHLNPTATLSRGYSIVRDQHGRIIGQVSQIEANDQVALEFIDGNALARIESKSIVPK